VFVDEEGKVYVADTGTFSAFVFEADGTLQGEITRPDSPVFGASNLFIPLKIAADRRGNIYVLCEGAHNGLVNLNRDGEFMGYFAANRPEVSLKMLFQRLIFSESQLDQLLKVKPPSPTNLALDSAGLVHTVTHGISVQSVKKFNIAGNNILPSWMPSPGNFVDLDLDRDDNIFALDAQGWVWVYNPFGELLFVFGGNQQGSERVGLMKNPVAIDVSASGEVFVLDKEKNLVTTFLPTPAGQRILEGDRLYREGLYLESEQTWQRVLDGNSSFLLAYRALGKASFKKGEYAQALEYFRLAQARGDYSEAFWQVRNDWLQQNAAKMMLWVFALVVGWQVVRFGDRKKGWLNPLRRFFNRWGKVKLLRELALAPYFLKNPFDACYELKRNRKASWLSASLLYLWLFMLQLLGVFFTGFIYSGVSVYEVRLGDLFLRSLAPLWLFVLANFLVSEISEGEGRFRDIYEVAIYAFTPILLFQFPLVLLTNVLTLNERFFVSFPSLLLLAWSLLLLFIGIKEIHNYTFWGTVKNLLLTVFTMVILVLVGFIVVVLTTQEVDFFLSLVQFQLGKGGG